MDKSLRNRAVFVCLVLVAGLTALSARLLVLQSWDRKFSEKGQINRFKMTEVLPASRGLVVDRHKQILAQNRPEATLIADANHLRFEDNLTSAVTHRYVTQLPGWETFSSDEKQKKFRATKARVRKTLTAEELRAEHLDYALGVLARELRTTEDVLRERIESGKKRIIVMKEIREDQARRIESELEKRYIQGFSFDRSQKRFYPMPGMAPHIVGFVNHKGIGQAGIERTMQKYLQGRPGERQLKRDANGLVLLTEAAAIRPPILGKHVQLALDIGIQAIAEEELQLAIDHSRAKRGCIIIVDPHTGDVLAMANRPHYNLNTREDFQEGGQNYAMEEQYEAGSVMKIVAMSTALDRRVANRKSVVHCGWGKIERPGITVRDHHNYGDLTFDQVLMKSSNPGAFLFAEKVGRAAFYESLENFGFGEETGFPLPNEASGRIADRSNMQNFATATYGYGVSVTPLQLAMAYSVLANGGKLMKPRLIKSVIANNGIVVERRKPVLVRQVVNQNTAREMCLALEQVVADGTGRRAAIPGYRVGGKTGTAWKYIPELKGYDQNRYTLSFAGMVPAHDPKFVAVVVIDDPSFDDPEAQIGGGTVAAPVFKRVAERVVDLLNIDPTEPIELNPSEVATTSN
ncbi:MAG: peptidoglycan D,D-transpeptidase FtsI family protein [Verrucomicrobiaceae bacterium]